MLFLFLILFVLAAAAGYGWLQWTGAKNRKQEDVDFSDLAKEGLKRITDIPRDPNVPRQFKTVMKRRASDPAANTAQPESAAREIADRLEKKDDSAGPWQRGVRTY